MSKRNWADIKTLEAVIMELRAEGKTRQKIADKLGLNFVQIKNWVNRHNREQKRIDAGLPPKRRGCPHKGAITSEAEYQYEIDRLRMENKLPRDFLQFTGRR